MRKTPIIVIGFTVPWRRNLCRSWWLYQVGFTWYHAWLHFNCKGPRCTNLSKLGHTMAHPRFDSSCMCLVQKFANSQCCRFKVGYASSETFYSKNKDDTNQDLKSLDWLAESARFAQETSSFEGTAHFKSIIEKPWKWVFYIFLTSANQPFVTGCNWLRDRHCVNLVRLFQELLM